MTENNPIDILSAIDVPGDLRKLSVSQLPEVCQALRNFIIDACSCNPGHFGSSMGAIEITVALHYVFNTPYDRIVWDVGHQAYGHKILTGRRDRFATNRKLNGLSGFPNPAESEYDAFIGGHASNSISAALGMAIATELQNDAPARKVVAVIGDASIAGGLAFEGLNNASINPNDLLIILNDNDMAIDRNVGGLNSYLVDITTSQRYNNMRNSLYQLFKKAGLIGEENKGSILRFNNSLKSLLSKQQNIFEGLNIRYFGPADGHDVENIVRILQTVKDMKGPKILHLCTIKGKGFAPAEVSPTLWHAPGKFDKTTGEVISNTQPNQPAKFQDVFGHTLVELAEENERIVSITPAMPTGSSMNFMMERFPKRSFDVGISEEHAVTFSAGLAKEGMLPYCCIYSSFLQRAYDEVIHDVAIQNLPVTFCIDRAGIVGEDGVTHHGCYDMSYLRAIPGMTIAAPMDEHTLRHLLYTAQAVEHGPLAIRYPRGGGEIVDWHCPMKVIPLGKGRRLKEGDGDIAVLSIGNIGTSAAKAIEMAQQQGVSVAHYDMIFLKPLDEELLHEVATRYKCIVTVENGTVVGGLGTAVIEWLMEHGYTNRVKRVGIPDRFIAQGTVAELHKLCGMDPDSIAQLLIANR